VRALPSVEAAKVSLIDNSALVKLNPSKTSQDAVFKAVESLGYNVSR
jgi:Cu+-exporting ATPase